MDREQFIKQQNAAADDKLAWTSGEDDARERFLRLAMDTYDYLISTGIDGNREYFEVRGRNPRLELRDAMQDISESNDASSWPAGYERRIWDWVEASEPSAPPPFDDRRGIVAPEFFHRLRELRRLCGGWLYWNHDLKDVVFAPEPEWLRVRADQERREASFSADGRKPGGRSNTRDNGCPRFWRRRVTTPFSGKR